jgi:tetrahydromethanopterin S-methyltransferase subunit A
VLSRNGMDMSGKIIGAARPYRILESPSYAVEAFRRQVQILDMIGRVNIDKITEVLIA